MNCEKRQQKLLRGLRANWKIEQFPRRLFFTVLTLLYMAGSQGWMESLGEGQHQSYVVVKGALGQPKLHG